VTVFERDSELYRLLRPPRLRSVEDGERHASYLELFFDVAPHGPETLPVAGR
jgi:hypothetical protein